MKARLTRRSFLLTSLFASGYVFGQNRPITQANRRRPNIIFLMDDQHRWDAFGFINPLVQTPTLDRLARNGLFFDQATCQAPMCVPSRNAMMLGLYPNQTGILTNGGGMTDKQLPVKPLPQLFKDAGYQTAGFGKTHWGRLCGTRGFEVRYEAACRETGAVMMEDEAPDSFKRYGAESARMGGGEENNLGYLGFTSTLPESDHRDGWVTAKCLEFIENGIDSDRPLFLYLSCLKPHAGHNVPAGFEDRYDLTKIPYAKQPPWDQDDSPHALNVNRRPMYIDYWCKASDLEWRQMTLRYWANCTWIDDMFGRTLAALEKKGILDNALILYVSDHGEMLGERYYRFNKYCLYESSVRVPVILSGSALPGGERGGVDHRPAQLVDVAPTLLKAAGIPVPAAMVGLDLLGDTQHPAGFCALHERPAESAFMWRTARHKLILMFKRKPWVTQYTQPDIIGGELYDLEQDPREWRNRYNDPAWNTIQTDLTRQLLDFLHNFPKGYPQTT